MRLKTNAVCMASPASNPYGQSQAPVSKVAPPTTGHIYYSDYNQGVAQIQTNKTRSDAINVTALQQQQQLQQQHMNQPSILEQRSVVHISGSSLGNYDSYVSGMSSDSELTNASTAARHHHSRPFSSQSRVYHAHPGPRNTPATNSSRLSHYSNTNQSGSIQASAHQNAYSVQQQLQQHDSQAILTMTLPSHQMSPAGNQGPMAPSGNAPSPAYLPAMLPTDSPVSPVLMQQTLRQKSGGRQLPQRPFKQSMSIDHYSMSNNNQYQPASGLIASNPQAHQQASGMSRNMMTSDQLAAFNQQTKSYPSASHQLFESTTSNQYDSPSRRNIRLDMEMVEKRAANLSLYDKGESSEVTSELPPTSRPPRSSSSTTRHLPPIVSSQPGMILEQQYVHQQIDPFHQDQYMTSHSQQQLIHRQHQKLPSASLTSDWLPPIAATSGQMRLGRPDSHFKQTMSIDHYSIRQQQQQQQLQQHQQHHQQQHQRHFSPARQSQFASSEQYHSLGSYAGPSPVNQPYDSTIANQIQVSDYYSSGGINHDHQTLPQYHHYPTQQRALHQQHGTASPSSTVVLDHDRMLGDKVIDCTSSNLIGGGGSSSVMQQHSVADRAKLQQQPSSSSSNSNLSGSLNSSNVENITNLDKQTSNSEHHQKSLSSASTSSHYQQSPQHNPLANKQYAARQDLLRRGYTSITTPGTSYGIGDFGGSQSALSESGDFSASLASHVVQGTSNRRSGLRAASPSVTQEACSSSGVHHNPHNHHHSTSSGQSARDSGGIRSESSTGLPNGSASNSTLTKKSNSATQLSMTGTKKRLGFRKKQVTSFSVHRSEEVAPLEARHLVKQGSSVSEGDSSMSGDSSSRSWSNSNFKQQTSEELASMSFIDGLGKGQMISRQGLACPYLGDIQLSLCDRRGNLEIEIIRARNLQAKANKILPLTYVKLYLVKNRKCLAKAKTTLSNKRTLNPLFQQQLTFHEDYHGCILQSIVWGNFGKMNKKNFMGIAQISIDDLELGDTVISWYKLFLPSSLQTLPSKSLRHTLLSNSTESFTTTNNS